VELLYIVIAAGAGYIATMAHKGYEVSRAIALEIDSNLAAALEIALSDVVDVDRTLGAQLEEQLRTA